MTALSGLQARCREIGATTPDREECRKATAGALVGYLINGEMADEDPVAEHRRGALYKVGHCWAGTIMATHNMVGVNRYIYVRDPLGIWRRREFDAGLAEMVARVCRD